MIIHTQHASSERDDAGLVRFLSGPEGGDRDGTPTDVEPGSDADIDRDDEDEDDEDDLETGSEPGSEAAEPSLGEDDEIDLDDDLQDDEGEQMDDNIDDLGRRPDGSEQEQPGIPSRS